MIDFSKLMNQTPEQRAEAMERQGQEFEVQMQARLAQRCAEIACMEAAIAARPTEFTDWDKQFVHDLRQRSETVDVTGWRGGKLLDLSTNQSRQIKRLLNKAEDKPESQDAPGAPAPNGKRIGFRPR